MQRVIVFLVGVMLAWPMPASAVMEMNQALENVMHSDYNSGESAKKKMSFSMECPARLAVNAPSLEKPVAAEFEFMPQHATVHALQRLHIFSERRVFEPATPIHSDTDGAEWMLLENGRVKYVVVCDYVQTPARLQYRLPDALERCKSTRQPEEKSDDRRAPPGAAIKLECF